MKNILVTGGLGFIGTNLVKELRKDPDNNIYIVDNCSSNSTNKDEYVLDTHIAVIRGDICELIYLLPHYMKFDEIYHLACPASPPFYWKDPIHVLDTCYIGTKQVLEMAFRMNSKVVFTSTSEVYGDALQSPQTEDYYGNTNSFGERSCYDEGKRVAESLCFEYLRKGVDVRIARLFNCYGSHMNIDDGRIVTEVIKSLIQLKNLDIYGDGTQTRSFCYVDDTVEALMRLMASPKSEEINSPINIGNPEEQTINHMVDETVKAWNALRNTYRCLGINYCPKRNDDPCVRKPNISKANRVLNWYPKTSFYEGITKTIEYFFNKEVKYPNIYLDITVSRGEDNENQ